MQADKDGGLPLCKLESLDGLEDSLQVALLVLEYGRGQFLLDKRHVVQDDGVCGRHVAGFQQSLLALAQLRTLVVSAGQVHQHVRVVVLEELLHAVLVLAHAQS